MQTKTLGLIFSLLAANAAYAEESDDNWAGFYLGANAGYGWGHDNTGELSGSANFDQTIASGVFPSTFGLEPSGAIGGGQVGYNWQMDEFVVGLETDFQASGVDSETNFTTTSNNQQTPPAAVTASSSLDWFGTVRARLGYSFIDNMLLYATGGYAYGGIEDSYNLTNSSDNNEFIAASNDATKSGWTIGGGGEYAFAERWTIRIEYLFVDLGDNDITAADSLDPGGTLTYSFDHSQSIVRAGINYLFDF